MKVDINKEQWEHLEKLQKCWVWTLCFSLFNSYGCFWLFLMANRKMTLSWYVEELGRKGAGRKENVRRVNKVVGLIFANRKRGGESADVSWLDHEKPDNLLIHIQGKKNCGFLSLLPRGQIF